MGNSNADLFATGFLLTVLGAGSLLGNHVLPLFSGVPEYVRPAIVDIRDAARGHIREAREEVRRTRGEVEHELRHQRQELSEQEREIRGDWRREQSEFRREALELEREVRRTRDEVRDELRETFRRPMRVHFE